MDKTISIENILRSGHHFEEDEALLQFRYRMLNSIMFVISLFSLLFALMNSFKINNIGEIHGTVDYIYSVSMVGLIFWLRRSKIHYYPTVLSMLTISLCVFTSALLFVPQDEFRIIWFYLLIFASYMIGGTRIGFWFAVLSIADIMVCSYLFDLELSDIAITSAIFGLIIGSLFSHFYTKKINDYNNMLHMKNEELKHLASYDFLTDLMNRRVFLLMGNKYFETAKRHLSPLSFLMIDIDHFKTINDTYGHEVGDKALKLFASILKSFLREGDLLGRLGGEEFGVILPGTNLEEAIIVAEKIRSSIANTQCQNDKNLFTVTASIGIAEISASDVSLEKLQKRADYALYKAKNNGRNQLQFN